MEEVVGYPIAGGVSCRGGNRLVLPCGRTGLSVPTCGEQTDRATRRAAGLPAVRPHCPHGDAHGIRPPAVATRGADIAGDQRGSSGHCRSGGGSQRQPAAGNQPPHRPAPDTALAQTLHRRVSRRAGGHQLHGLRAGLRRDPTRSLRVGSDYAGTGAAPAHQRH